MELKKELKIEDENLSKISGGKSHISNDVTKYKFRVHQYFTNYDNGNLVWYSVNEDKEATIDEKIFCFITTYHGNSDEILNYSQGYVDVRYLLTCKEIGKKL